MSLNKKYFDSIFLILHLIFWIIIGIIYICLPLKYAKYFSWLILAITIHWIIFNGCIFDCLHQKNCNNDNIPDNSIVKFIKIFNEDFANNIDNLYFKNTLRSVYLIFSIHVLLLTIIIYRLIYNIDFF